MTVNTHAHTHVHTHPQLLLSLFKNKVNIKLCHGNENEKYTNDDVLS